MGSFINKFLPEYSPSRDEKVISEFKRAHETVRQFKPSSEKMGACFEKIRSIFSEETYDKYQWDVDAFLGRALDELEYKVSVIGTQVLLSPTTAFSDSITPPVSPYLQGYLYEFARFITLFSDGAYRPSDVKDCCEAELERFYVLCDEYKTMSLGDGIPKQADIDQAKKCAELIAQDAQSQAAKIFSDFEEIKSLCPKRFKLARICQAWALKPFLTHDTEKAFKFFVSKIPIEDIPIIVQKKFQFISSLANDTNDFFEKCDSALSCIEDISSGAWDPLPLYKNAETTCRKIFAEESYKALLKLCKNPLRGEVLLRNLSDASRDALKNVQTANLALGGLNLPVTESLRLIAVVLEHRIALIIRMRELQFSDNEICQVLEKSFQVYIKTYVANSFFEPHTELIASSKETIIKVLQADDNCVDLVRYILHGGSAESYRAVYERTIKNFSEFEMTKKTVAALENLSEEELTTCNWFADLGILQDRWPGETSRPGWSQQPSPLRRYKQTWGFKWNEKTFLQLIEILHNKELCDAYKRWASCDVFIEVAKNCQTLINPDEFKEISIVNYLRFPLEERYLFAKYASPREDPILYFYSSEAACHLEEDIATVPLSIVPTEPLLRYLGSKPFSTIKVWLEQTIQTSEGKKTRLETISPKQKKAILTRFVRDKEDMPLPTWMDLFQIQDEEVRKLCERMPCKETVSGLMTVLDQPIDPSSFLVQLPEITRSDAILLLRDVIFSATETSNSGGRPFLTWDKAQASSSCASQDDPTLHCKDKAGLFNDVLNERVAAVPLRRKLLDIEREDPDWLTDVLVRESPFYAPTFEEEEVLLELVRILDHVYAKFPYTSIRSYYDN